LNSSAGVVERTHFQECKDYNKINYTKSKAFLKVYETGAEGVHETRRGLCENNPAVLVRCKIK
jgi:predicted N-acyltransferase